MGTLGLLIRNIVRLCIQRVVGAVVTVKLPVVALQLATHLAMKPFVVDTVNVFSAHC